MKRYYKGNHSLEELLELDILVEFSDNQEILSASIMNINDSKFLDFEADILDACDQRGYELESDYSSPVEGSISHYYIYTKVQDGIKLRVLVKIRLSDHYADDKVIKGQKFSEKQLSENYTRRIAKAIAEEKYHQKRGYKPRNINIVFNDENYTSYEDALCSIEDSLDSFDNYTD